MTLLARSPRNCGYNYRDEWMPSILNDWFNNVWPADLSREFGDFTPKVNVHESDKAYTLELAVPGMTKDHINLHLEENNTLVIKAEKEKNEKCDKEGKCEKKDEKNNGYLRREFCYNRFEERFALPEDADIEAINAQMDNGVLTVTLPKKAPVAPEKLHRVIEIK